MSCGVGFRCSSDPAFLWLWCRPVATAPIRPLAWELPYAEGAALEKAKKQNNNNKKKDRAEVLSSVPKSKKEGYDVLYKENVYVRKASFTHELQCCWL